MLAERIYTSLPLFAQNWLVSLQGRRLHQQRYGARAFTCALEELTANESAPIDQLRCLQLLRLREFARHCYHRSPYYRQAFDQAGITPDDIRSLDCLSRFPITAKETMRRHVDRFFTEGRSPRMTAVHTSGTTGSPLTVYFSPADITTRYALLERCRAWAGVAIGEPRATFSGKNVVPPHQQGGPYWRFNRYGNQLLFSSYHLAPENLDRYVTALESFQPQMIDGYPSAIHVLAEHILRHQERFQGRPRAVLLTAETVLPHQRRAIEAAFHCQVFNQYASSDGAPFISECSRGRLHIRIDSGVVEILRADDTPALPGEVGELVVTSFTTHVTPMFRFRTGDTAVPSAETQCPCGLPFPMVESILGRVDDLLFTPERGYVGRMDTVFKGLPNSILEAQIVQHSATVFALRVVPEGRSYRMEHALRVVSEMQKRLGQVTIAVEVVSSLPRTPRGKLRAVVNQCASSLPPELQYEAPEQVN
jgi:phenylacetate-CoA ligase